MLQLLIGLACIVFICRQAPGLAKALAFLLVFAILAIAILMAL